MKSRFKLCSTDAQPSERARLILSSVPFALLIAGYFWAAYARHAENPDDRVMPLPLQIVEGAKSVAFEADNRTGEVRLWKDTWASGKRFAIALAAVMFGVVIGVQLGAFPYHEALGYRFMLTIDKIAAISILPILFVFFGVDEMTKIALIVIGVLPTVALDAYLQAKAVPQEQFHKARTLGASEWEIAYRVILPQIWPRVLDTIRLNFKSMALLLIAAEAIAADAGLGYRIFVVRRYMAMDIIIPYVIWITSLLYLLDLGVRKWIERQYPWVSKQ